jgi:tetratricopeptide (TPR) repeat protein
MDFPQIFTFYSFKGGVGRSMAVLNVAYAMAAKGRHVLVLDMDLEAPGLSGFLLRHSEIGALARRDMVDLVGWASDMSPVFAASECIDPEPFPPLTDFVVPVLAKQPESRHPYSELGRLDIIAVDEERDYYERLTALGIGGFDRDALVNVGSVLRAWLKSRRFAVDVPDYYGPDAERTAAYDYVLVDSRTGISETGGLCIGPLSDQLVVLAALNDQNVEGTRGFLQEVGILAKQPSTPTTDGPGEERSVQRLDPKPTLIVASPVPAGEIATKRDRLEQLEKAIGQAVVKLSYHPQMALLESIFTRDFRDEYLAREYDALLQQILQMASDGVDSTIVEDRLDVARLSLGQFRELAPRARRGVSATGVADNFSLLLTRHVAEVISKETDFILWDRVCRALSAVEGSKRFDGLTAWANLLSQWTLRSTIADLARLRREAAMCRYEEVFGSKSASPRQRAQALCDRGVTYGRLDDHKNAIVDFTAVIQMPDAPAAQKAAALFNRGVAYTKWDEREKAMADFTAVIEMPEAPAARQAAALVSRGLTYGPLDDPEKAMADYTAVMQMPDAPTDQKVQALSNRGVMYGQLNEPAKAIADYTAVIEMPDAPTEQKVQALSNRGWAYFSAERYREAIDDEQRAVKLDPKNCTARGNLAIALLVDDQTIDALAAYDSALAIADVKDVEAMATDLNDAVRKQGTLPGAEEALARLEKRRKQLSHVEVMKG